MAIPKDTTATVEALRAKFGDGGTYLTRAEVAEMLRTSIPTLERWQQEGRGPRSRLIGRRRLYRLGDVIAFAQGESAVA